MSVASQSAFAQVAATAGLQSNYVYRGVSLSHDEPAASLVLSYDHPTGAFASVALIGADTEGHGARFLGHQLYAGVAGKFASGAAWDFGIADTDAREFGATTTRISYQELYGGLSWRNVSSHIYYAPDYMGEGVRTVYVNVEGSHIPAPNWTLSASAGVLAPLDAGDTDEIRDPQFDLSLGAARKIGQVELALRFTHHGPHGGYSPSDGTRGDNLILALSYSF